MRNNKKNRRRSNSFDLYLNQNKTSEEEDEIGDILNKPNLMKRKKMITYKRVQNIDIIIYNQIFVGLTFLEGTVQDFSSFIQYLNNIKSKYNPSLMKNNNLSEGIKNENKFSLTHDNITKLLSFHKNTDKNVEISKNTRYIKVSNLNDVNNYNNIVKLIMMY